MTWGAGPVSPSTGTRAGPAPLSALSPSASRWARWRFAGRLLLTKHHFPPARGHDASGAPALTVAVETPGAFRSPSNSLNRDSAPPVFPVSRGFPVTTPGEGLLLSCPVLSGPFC